MNRHSILTKTAKGLLEATGKTSDLSRDQRNLLKEVDGKLSVSQLQKKLDDYTEPKLMESLGKLEREGYIKEFTPVQDDEPRRGPPSRAPSSSDSGEDLDFTAVSSSRTPGRPSQAARPPSPPVDDIARQARAREEAGAKAKAEAAAREADARARAEADARARAQAQERTRKELEERTRREADEKRREAEVRARVEAEERSRKEAEERVRREAADRARREMEDRARREAEERARREAEEKAKREATERARREVEERARREADERVRREAEEKRREADERARKEADEKRREAEVRARADAEQRIRREIEERDAREEIERRKREEDEKLREEQEARELANMERIEAEVRAKREAEERTRESEERTLRESQERARRDADERARREAEQLRRTEEDERRRLADEASRAEEETRSREEEMRKREEEMRKREEEEEERAREEQKKRADAQAEADAEANKEARAREKAIQEEQKRAEAEERKRKKAMTPGREHHRRGGLGKSIAIGLFLILVISVVVVHFVPMDAAPYEKAAEEWLGQPVRIGSVYVAVVPTPQLRFEKVTIGKDPQVQIASVKAWPELGSLFGDSKSLKRLEVESAVVPKQFLSALIYGKPSGGDAFRIERITGKKIKLEVPGFTVPEFDVNAVLDTDGAPKTITFTAERKLTVTLQPQSGGRATLEMLAQNFALPIAEDLVLEDFSAKGMLSRNEIAFSEFEARAMDGFLQGNGRLRWNDGWSLDGELSVRQLEAAQIAAPLLGSGKVEGKGTYAMKAAAPEKLFASARLEGNFTIQKGSITSVDMTRVLQGATSTSGTTLFSEMTGSASAEQGRVQVRNLRMAAGLLQGAGNIDVDPEKNLSGRFQIELRAQTMQARTTLVVTGTLKEPQFRRTN